MDINEVVETEIMEEIKASGKNGMKTAAVIGVSAIGGALLWERVIKPIGRKIKTKLNDMKKHDSGDNVDDANKRSDK